jgi:hypothetical protein
MTAYQLAVQTVERDVQTVERVPCRLIRKFKRQGPTTGKWRQVSKIESGRTATLLRCSTREAGGPQR